MSQIFRPLVRVLKNTRVNSCQGLSFVKRDLNFVEKSGCWHCSFPVRTIHSMDPTQLALLEEPCIQVDENDLSVGKVSKKNAHLLGPNKTLPPLHRAFSVFLFNSKNELLLQRRSNEKITFPGYYTNTCCSHPLYTDEEREENNHLGIRKAARRRLEIELGIKQESVDLSDLKILTRVHYGAPSDSTWGEHEIDYIIFMKKDLAYEINANEVQEVAYISRDAFADFMKNLASENIPITPWFQIISKSFLPTWWARLESFDDFSFDPTIHRY